MTAAMTMGPVEYIVIEFPGNQFKGEIVPALRDLVASGTIRILDLVFVKKDADGKVEAIELAALSPEEAAAFDDLEGDVAGLLNEEDVQLVADELAPDSSAGLLVWENAWATRFADAVRNANGRVVASERIPRDVVEAALEAAPVRD